MNFHFSFVWLKCSYSVYRLVLVIRKCFIVNINKKKKNVCTYQPPARVNVKPKRESRSTDTRMPIIPSPCGVITWPRITDTRLQQRVERKINEKNRKRKKKHIPEKSDVSYHWTGGGEFVCFFFLFFMREKFKKIIFKIQLFLINQKMKITIKQLFRMSKINHCLSWLFERKKTLNSSITNRISLMN